MECSYLHIGLGEQKGSGRHGRWRCQSGSPLSLLDTWTVLTGKNMKSGGGREDLTWQAKRGLGPQVQQVWQKHSQGVRWTGRGVSVSQSICPPTVSPEIIPQVLITKKKGPNSQTSQPAAVFINNPLASFLAWCFWTILLPLLPSRAPPIPPL
jgi:hypothetical protein